MSVGPCLLLRGSSAADHTLTIGGLCLSLLIAPAASSSQWEHPTNVAVFTSLVLKMTHGTAAATSGHKDGQKTPKKQAKEMDKKIRHSSRNRKMSRGHLRS